MIFDVLGKGILHLYQLVGMRSKECFDDERTDGIPLLRLLPQAMVDGKKIAYRHFLTILHKGRGTKQAHDVLPATVAHIHMTALGCLIHIHGSQGFADSRNGIEYLLLHSYTIDGLRPFRILLGSNRI